MEEVEGATTGPAGVVGTPGNLLGSDDNARLHSLYARFKASSFRFDFGDAENLATLAAIPLVQAHMCSASTFSEHELFSIIFRFNCPYPSPADELTFALARSFAEAEVLEIATTLVLRCVLRVRYHDARSMLAHVCGPHNTPDLRFFLTHDHAFIVIPRQPQTQPQQDPRTARLDGEGDDGDEADEGDQGEACDAANPWVMLRSNVRHEITDKASVVAALQAILNEARDQRLTLLVLRQRFERDCGVPFGCTGVGSLTSFLKAQRSCFHVAEARKKKNLKSTVSLVSSSSSSTTLESGNHHHHHKSRGQGRGSRQERGQARGRGRGRGQGQSGRPHPSS